MGILCFLYHQDESINCKSLKCPDDRPFCTPIGCVVECPENDFVNGSTCLKSCNGWFIGDNRTCQVDCPSQRYIKEKAVRNGDTYDIERHCVKLCDPVSVFFNRTCLPECPQEAKFLDGKKCVKKCPNEKKIISQLSPEDKYLSCKNVCHSNVYEKGVCVKYCKHDGFVFNNTCVEVCPDEANLLRVEGRNTICTRQCDKGTVNQNGSCVEYCQENEFVYNGSCVSKCPQNAPLMQEGTDVEFCPSCKTNNYCVNLCPTSMFLHHQKCVTHCPDGLFVYNRSCVSKCPDTEPIAVTRSSLYSFFLNCETTCENTDTCLCPIQRPYLYNGTCHVVCPPSSNFTRQYSYSQGCVDKCNSKEFIHDRNCVSSCPFNASFVYNRQCMEDCPKVYIQDPWYARYIQCVDQCPPYKQFAYKNECVPECPSDQKYVYDFTCTDTCLPRFVDETSYECLDECKSNKYIYNNTSCVSTCPNDQKYMYNFTCTDTCKTMLVDETSYECLDQCGSDKYVYNKTSCVSKCPNDQKYVYGKTCTDTCGPRFIDETSFECLDECKSGKYIYNKTHCVSICPNDQKYVYNFTCTDICPTKFTDENSKTCVEECKIGKYVYNDSICVSLCPSTENFIHNKTCTASDCSSQLRYIHKTSANVECMDKCPIDTYINNTYECVHHCLHHGSYCVDTCPEEAPYVEDVGIRGAECKLSCSQKRINNTCVESCPSGLPYLYENECLDHCPSITRAIQSDFSGKTKKCVKKCDDNYVVLDKKCIREYECRDPNLVFGDECLEECPSGYIFIDDGCTDKKIFIVTIAVLIGVLIIITVWNRRNFTDFIVYSMYALINCQVSFCLFNFTLM